jgi:hypothetical protein
MKAEKPKTTRHTITDADRDHVLKLCGCGLTNNEIANMLHISSRSVTNIRMAHAACIRQDWSALQKLSTTIRPTVDWAMQVTGVDKVFAETFPKEDVPTETPPVTPAPETITREEFQTLSTTLQDICYLLTEIRDLLK